MTPDHHSDPQKPANGGAEPVEEIDEEAAAELDAILNRPPRRLIVSQPDSSGLITFCLVIVIMFILLLTGIAVLDEMRKKQKRMDERLRALELRIKRIEPRLPPQESEATPTSSGMSPSSSSTATPGGQQ